MAQMSMEVNRLEHKYLLSMDKSLELERRLSRALQPDEHNLPGGYRVKSLYFDTADNADYYEKDAGIHDRRKIRLRLYDEENSVVLLERKQKAGDYQSKVSVALSPQAAQRFYQGERGLLLAMDSGAARELYFDAVAHCRPAAMIEYRRVAFCWPEHNTRITLDREIRYTETHLDLFSRNLPYYLLENGQKTVLEVKYDLELEPFIREILAPYCHSRLSYGKYERCRRLL